MSSPPADLRRPLGLALSGGGALGAWQIGALHALVRSGLRFDAVWGFSAGALNAAAYALGRVETALERWRAADMRLLKFAPRLSPFSLFSDRPLRGLIGDLVGEDDARRALRCPLTVVTAVADRTRPLYAAFEPGGRWQGPLEEHLLASCAIPLIFPRRRLEVDGRAYWLFDGGVPCDEPLNLGALGSCADVLMLEMVREDEVGLPARGLVSELNQRSKDTVRRLMNQAAASLRGGKTRVLRLAPSRSLGMSMLDFRAAGMLRALAQGERDAEAFLAAPSAPLDAPPQN